MKLTVCSQALSTTFGSVVAVVGLAACGGNSASRVDGAPVDASLTSEAGNWPAEVTVQTCTGSTSVTVGSYVVQANYWNKRACPGTQCMKINSATGAFTVTQGPDACGNTVATYPNVLYGCSFGNCSPASLLPMPVGALSTVTSSWDFSVGGTASDQYDVAYDIWFCPDQTCGSSGFPGGTEMMIWLDYKNTAGWQTDLGSVTLGGHTWEVWQAPMGQAGHGWTYLAYMIKGPAVDSVTDLDLNAFFRDAVARGLIEDSWYLYAIQAGDELRTGGVPYDSNSFSVSINGVTPSTAPIPAAGPSCDGSVPTADGALAVTENYVTAGPLHGYASAWSWVGTGSQATTCITPTCSAPGSLQVTAVLSNGVAPLTAEPVSCSPAFPPSALCTAGTVTADPSYNQVAGVGFNFNQGVGIDGGADPDGGAAGSLGTIFIPSSITLSATRAGNLLGNSALRVQLTDANDTFYCYGGAVSNGTPIPIGQFNTKCWDNSGIFATPSTLWKRVDVLVPGTASTDEPFAFCLTSVTVQ